MAKKLDSYFWLFGALALAYLLVTILVPLDPEALERYGLTSRGAHVIGLTFTVPYVAIWFAAFYGFVKLRGYAHMVRKSSEGPGLAQLARGHMVLAVALPVSAIVNSVLGYLRHAHPQALPAATIMHNYLSLTFFLVGFWLVFSGARMLAGRVRRTPSGRVRAGLLLVWVLLGAIYVYFSLTNPVRTTPGDSGPATYYLEDCLIVATILLPYLAVWYWGLMAAYYINFYRKYVKGVIYREFLHRLSFGITAVIAASALVQMLGAFSSTLMELSLPSLLVLIYLLLLFVSVGYVFIALGAKRLARIEEV